MNNELDEYLKLDLVLARLKNKSLEDLKNELEKANKNVLNKYSDTDFNKKRDLTALLKVSDREYNSAFSSFPNLMSDEISQVAESSFNTVVYTLNPVMEYLGLSEVKLWDKVVSESLKQSFMNPNFDILDGRTLAEETKHLGELMSYQARRVLRDSFNNGVPVKETAKSLQNLSNKYWRSAETIAITTNNKASQIARAEAEKKFDDVIKGYMWVSVLDGRTTFGCQSLNGKIKDTREDFAKMLGMSAPVPPRHFRCRSTLLPITVLTDTKNLELPFAIHDERKVKHRPVKLKSGATVSGGTSTKFTVKQGGTTTIEQPRQNAKRSVGDTWLERMDRKDDSFVQKYFGKERYKLWKDNKLTLKDMVDKRGDKLTIKELKEKLLLK